MRNERDLQYYLTLPYTVEIAPTEDGTGFTAAIPALKGCIAFGESVEEAYEMVAEVKEAWLDIALEEGWEIPEPAEEDVKEYSGRFNVRLPRYLHRRLAESAEVEDTSLNQLVVALLSEGIERRRQRHRSTQFVNYVFSSSGGLVGSLERALNTWGHQRETSPDWPGVAAGMQATDFSEAIQSLRFAQSSLGSSLEVWRKSAANQSSSPHYVDRISVETGDYDTAD